MIPHSRLLAGTIAVLAGAALALIVPAGPAAATEPNPPQALPQAASEDDLKWQPALDYDTDGCYNVAAIGPDGAIAQGLSPNNTTTSGSCRDQTDLENSNAYARQRCNNGWCIHLYGYYFEKDVVADNVPDDAGHVHDWEHIAVWAKDGEAKYVGASGHGHYDIRAASAVLWDGTHPKVVYHKDGASTHAFRFASSGDEPPENHYHQWWRSALVSWDGFPAGLRDDLVVANFGSATFALKDSQFPTDIARAIPRTNECVIPETDVPCVEYKPVFTFDYNLDRPNVRLLPLGDSITYGIGTAQHSSYRADLYPGLKAVTTGLDFVGSMRSGVLEDTDNEGHKGWRIEAIDNLIRACTMQHYRPNVITLHAGTNDMIQAFQVATAPDRLRNLIDDLLAGAPEAAVVVSTLVPSTDPATNERISQFNVQVLGVVNLLRAQGKHVRLVMMDLVQADMADLWHPNANGYKKMAAAFQAGVQGVIDDGWVQSPHPGDLDHCATNVETPPDGNNDVHPWQPQGVVAAGVGVSGSRVRFADINGDGRDDYLTVGDAGQVESWLNNRGGSGAPWLHEGVIASNTGATADQVRFADIDGDGRDDYLKVGDAGEVQAWLNNRGAASGSPAWLPQGQIAEGGSGATRDLVRFADIDGDGRDDYIVLSARGRAEAWFNNRGGRGDPWLYQGEIAEGVGMNPAYIRFTDLNFDGRDDYIAVGDHGEVYAWLNNHDRSGVPWLPQGQIAEGVTLVRADQVIFADLDGDLRNDYLVAYDSSAVGAWLNVRYHRDEPWDWEGVVATGGGVSGDRVLFADVNGDGRDDYLVVEPTSRVSAWLNNRAAGTSPAWLPRGQIAVGVGKPGSQIRFADIDGDGKDDYLWVGDAGQVQAWRNNWGGSGDPWTDLGVIASNTGATGDQVRFGDIDGDGKDDYLVADGQGRVKAWRNNRGGSPTWQAMGEIVEGVGAAGGSVAFADVNGDRKDDYLVLGDYGQVRAWINNRGGTRSWLVAGAVAKGFGVWRGHVEFGDLNGDRRADYQIVDDARAVTSWINAHVDIPATQ